MRALVFAAVIAPIIGFSQVFPNGSFESIHNITGTKDNQVRSVAAGSDGSIYVAGLTNSADFTTTPQAARRTSAVRSDNQAEVFIRKLSPDGRQLIFSTLVGPSRWDWSLAMAVDAAGSAYVTYRPEYEDPQPVRSLEPSGALVIVKLSPDGSRFVYRASVLPDGFYGPPIGFAVDSTGSAYVAAGDSGFGIRKLDPTGTRIEAQTNVRCGDGRGLRANALALGPDNSVYVTGESKCTAFPASPNAYLSSTSQPQNGDAFVMRFAPNLASTVYATLLGGESVDQAFALAVAGDGSATVAGQTSRSRGLQSMPATPLGIAELREEYIQGFVARISPDGQSLRGAVLLPSPSATAVSVDAKGSTFVAGTSGFSAVFAKISPDLQTLHYFVDAPARLARLGSILVLNGRLVFGGSAMGRTFPDNDPSLRIVSFVGFVGSLPEDPVKTDLRLEIQAALGVREIEGSQSICRFVLTNRGTNEATRLLVAANSEWMASFQHWRAQPPIFNVPTLSTGSSGPVLAGVARLGAGESATIEFYSSNRLPNGIRCFGRVHSATADENPSDNEGSSLATTPPGQDPGNGPLPTRGSETSIYSLPVEIAAGTPGRVIDIIGSGMREGWQVLWNGQPRPTQYLSANQLVAELTPEDLERPSLGWISLLDPERNEVVRAPQALWVFLPLANSDVIFDQTRGRLWVASPGTTGSSQGQIVLIDPETGTIEQTLPIAAEAQTLALTDDGRFLYIAAPGRIFRLNIQDRVIDQDFPVPARDINSPPSQVSAMLAVPGRPDQLLVSLHIPFSSPSYGGTILFENGVDSERRVMTRDGPAQLYGWLHDGTAIGGDYRNLYHLTVENGVTLKRSFEGILAGPECVLETSLLYCNSGTVFDAATGTFVRQYPARGAVAVSLGTDRVVFVDHGTTVDPIRATLGPMVTVRESTAEFLSATTVPIGGQPGTLLRCGNQGLVYRPNGPALFQRRTNRMYLWKLP